ncbi:M13 family metallopeptidase [Maribacter polysaccharolyticus]|uniref:M13 family metallopeptidase n=1 Tax=Maribacter polysaccharolyticus TaxID=3020831 RepID=UPI00237F1AF7|nr:M13-type metalloendopeptidase [Maribacter polysaccharolyticus]MDE3741622.1 M13 family peptidase [Maribacter polysaccharolyticus]
MKRMSLLKYASALVIVLGIGCKGETEQKTEQKALISGVYKEFMDTTIKPGDDFNSYVNGGWLKTAEIPADKSTYGAFNILNDQSEENVKAIIEESAEGDFEVGSDEQKVGDLYASYMNLEMRNKVGVAPLKAEFDKIDAIKNYDDLATYFAYANKYRYTVPLGLFVYQDFKDPTQYAVYTRQSGLGLPDREYYLKDDARTEEIREKYVGHIEKMYGLAGLEHGKDAAGVVMALETKIAKEHLPKEKTRDLVSLYNMLPVDTLSNIMPRFNWDNYLSEAGLKDQKKLGTLMLDYSKTLDGIIASTDLDTWKTYLKWGVIDANASRLNEAMSDQNWSFFSKELRGTKEQRPLWRRGVTVVNRTLGEVVGKVYVKKHFPPEAKERMEVLVDNLLKAYEVSIKDLDWMGEDTKKEALEKLSKFTPKIGYPDKWKEYDLEIKADDLFGNLRRSDLMEFKRNLAKLGQPIDKTEWAITPQTVNAYYKPTMNEIVFPAAILQPPFFNMDADDAVNYGAIGAVIGHEIGHGFDDKGSTFDGDGAMRNWWTDADKEEFKKRTDALVQQYNGYEVLPGLYVNGEFTLGENIGDLGGLSIGLKAYKMSLNGKEAPEMDGFTGEQRVFLGYAQVWRKMARDEALRVQVNTNPHSPSMFRVNGIVRNVPDFYSAFNVQESDSLYLAPENRVKIW